MARIIVMADPSERRDAPVLLDERVCSAHIADNHRALELGDHRRRERRARSGAGALS
jgi:hypothetical protein